MTEDIVFVSVLSSPETFASLQKKLKEKRFQLEDLSGHIIRMSSSDNFDMPEAENLPIGKTWPWHNHEYVVRRIA